MLWRLLLLSAALAAFWLTFSLDLPSEYQTYASPPVEDFEDKKNEESPWKR